MAITGKIMGSSHIKVASSFFNKGIRAAGALIAIAGLYYT